MLHKTRKGKSNRAGFTLTEIAIVLGAVGLVLAAVWSVSSAVWNNSQSQQLEQQILTIAQNVRDYYTNKGKIYQDNANKTACASGASITALLDDNDRRLIPIEMREDPESEGGTIRHALGGEIQVECRGGGAGFLIKVMGLKKENCIRLLMQFPVLTPEVGVNFVNAGGTGIDINLLNLQTPGTNFPMELESADAYCNQQTNEVGFGFKLRN